jgi:cathepsin B
LVNDQVRVADAARINDLPGIHWRAGNARFQGLPLGTSQNLCGVKVDFAAHLASLLAAGRAAYYSSLTNDTLPKSFDSAEGWPACAGIINDIRDQSACGCCWAFAPASAGSDRLCIATNGTVQVPLSAQDACFCTQEFKGDCDGGYTTEPVLHLMGEGLVTGGQFNHSGPFASSGEDGFCAAYSLPHCHHHGPKGKDPYPDEKSKGCPMVKNSPTCPGKCDEGAHKPYDSWSTSGRYKVRGGGHVVQVFKPEDVESIQRSILEHGPVTASMDVYTDFEQYASGVYHVTSKKMLGGHAVRIVGWGEDGGVKYWKVANSWNQYWGEAGFFRIRRGTNEAAIEDNVLTTHDVVEWSGPGVRGKSKEGKGQ